MTLDRFAWFVGEIARPFAVIVTSGAAAIASVIAALRVADGTDGALLIAAIGSMVGAIYIGKSWEIAKVAAQEK